MLNTATSAAAATLPAHPNRSLHQRGLGDRSGAESTPLQEPAPLALSDADKYCWIRANRGHFAIAEALNQSQHNRDFDTRIEAAIQLWMQGRHFHLRLGDIPPRLNA